MLDPAQLAALAAVHRRGAFDLAAAELHVTPSAISQRIKALEERVGQRLITRASPCTATTLGLRLIRHHDECALLDQALARDLPQLSPGPRTLRLAVNADSLATWLMPALAACPDTLFDLVIDDQDVSLDLLRRGEVVAAITAEAPPLPGCDSQPLGHLRYRATAAPAFLARWMPEGVTPQALAKTPALTFSEKDRLQDRWLQRETRGAIAPGRYPTHRIASSTAFVEACRLGLGWAMNPEHLIRADLAAGRLVELIPGTPLDVALHWQFARIAAPALQPLSRALRAEAAAHLVA